MIVILSFNAILIRKINIEIVRIELYLEVQL